MNLFEYEIPKEDENFTTLFEKNDIKIVRIVSSSNMKEKEFIQDEDEVVFLLEGEATLEVEGKLQTLQKGQMLYIPAKTPHKLLKVSNGALWLAIHFKTK